MIDLRKINKDCRAACSHLLEGINPTLAIVQVGNNPASDIYIRNKIKACEEVGINTKLIKCDNDIDECQLIAKVNTLNEDKEVDSIIVQLPLPNHISEFKVCKAINPDKDVDGFSPTNIGKLVLGKYTFVPATAVGIMTILNTLNVYTNYNFEGKHCVVVGRSNIVGKPIAMLMLNEYNCTVTICHSKTKDLAKFTKDADILIVAAGKAKMITKDMVKEGAVVIDVGINRLDGKVVGDVDYENVKDKCSFITPVPGGVGPMTITGLISNVLTSKLLL